MTYRVCIPTAGTGSRLGDLTKFVNKSLVGIANRPTIAHLIEQFPGDVEFVIALGHKGHLVREFLELAFPHRVFHFAKVDPFEGPGSGLGLSLSACREFLQQPFVFLSCDTLVEEEIPPPSSNWMAYSEGHELAPYRTVEVSDGSVRSICEKGEGTAGSHKAYIGLAGIADFKLFWESMDFDRSTATAVGEVHGMRALLSRKISARPFTWHDTGNLEALTRTREAYREENAPNILEKANEAIWFVGDRVIKFSDDEKFIANRVARVDGLKGFVPLVTGSRPHMYGYARVEGEVLSKVITLPMFDRLLTHSKTFWKSHSLSADETARFRAVCSKFYREKTLERVQLFYKSFGRTDGVETINGIEMPTLHALLESVNWNWLTTGLAGRFHGDFHFENILWNAEDGSFTFLDWRQDFGGDLSVGDVYYDLAKLLHGLIICHELIAKDLFEIDWKPQEINYGFLRKQIHVECERRFGEWLVEEGFDRKKVIVLTALVYLNIAALHHHPYSLLLYALGKTMLFEELKNAND